MNRTRRAALLLLLALPGGAAILRAATVTVNDPGDVLHDSGCAATGSGTCTLRDAIAFANARPGPDVVQFAIGSGPARIALAAPLPAVTSPLTLDATTQPGWKGFPLVLVDGSGAGEEAPGLVVRAGASTVRGLAIGGFRARTGAALELAEKGGNRVEGCLVGAAGSGATANRGIGILVRGDRNTIGGARTGARNVVSGNGGAGIRIRGAGNVVAGNFVGLEATATRAAGNGGDGIDVSGGSTVGGAEAGAGNVVSGNRGVGIAASAADAILGNFVGTDAAGGSAVPNGRGGIAGGGRIGGTSGVKPAGPCAGACNLVSGNGGPGIAPAAGALVEGNFVGTNAAGDAALGNAGPGIFVNAASRVTVGGAPEARANLVSGNAGAGVEIAFESDGTVVAGNRVGTDAKGTAPLPNAEGVRIRDGARGSRIGGDATPEGNTIAFNAGAGVIRDASAGGGHTILSNAIWGNRGLGIDWNGDGVTPNRAPEAEAPPDAPPNFPVIEKATPYSVEGTLEAAPETAYTVQLFANPSCDPSGNGQGQTLLGTTTLMTDADGRAAFGVSLTASPGQAIAATATDAAGNTSEFSACAVAAGVE